MEIQFSAGINNSIHPSNTGWWLRTWIQKNPRWNLALPCIRQVCHFICSVVSDSLWPHGLQDTRLPCPSIPGACSNSCPLSWWYYPTISSSVIPFSSCLQSFSESGSFPMSRLFISGGQSFSFSISTSNEYSGLISFRIGWFYLPCSPRDTQESKSINSSKALIFWHSAFIMVQLSHLYMTTGKTIALTIENSVSSGFKDIIL